MPTCLEPTIPFPDFAFIVSSVSLEIVDVLLRQVVVFPVVASTVPPGRPVTPVRGRHVVGTLVHSLDLLLQLNAGQPSAVQCCDDGV